MIIKGGIYEHYSGKLYQIVAVARHTETQEDMIIYRPLYDCAIPFFARPQTMFLESLQKDDTHIPRFRYTGTQQEVVF